MSQRKFVPLETEAMPEVRKEILLLRGPSGSGKSTLGTRLLRSSHPNLLSHPLGYNSGFSKLSISKDDPFKLSRVISLIKSDV